MILVTGGAGFIGSNIVKQLNKQKIKDILIVDHLNNLKYKNLIDLDFDYYLDYRDFIKKLPTLKFNRIIHQGACSNTTESNADYIMDVNYNFSMTLLDYAIENKIPFLYASSASVYGLNKETKEIPENESPINLYAFSKLMFDKYVSRRLMLGQIESPVIGLRYFNVYGYGEAHKGRMASVPYQFYKQYKKDRMLRLFKGSDEFLRDFIYIDDVVDITLKMAYSHNQGIFNCGTGKTRSFLELAKICAGLIKQYDQFCGIMEMPFPKDLEGKYQTYTCSNNEYLTEIIGKYKFTILEDGIKQYYEKLRE